MSGVGIDVPDPDKQLTSKKTHKMLFALGRFIFSLHIFSYHLQIAILVSHFPYISTPRHETHLHCECRANHLELPSIRR